MRRTLVAAALAVFLIAAIVIGRRHATPRPVTPQETREVIAAISQIAPGSKVANLRRHPDGKVRAFLPGDPEGGQIVVVTSNSGVWRAAVEMDRFDPIQRSNRVVTAGHSTPPRAVSCDDPALNLDRFPRQARAMVVGKGRRFCLTAI